MTDFPATSLLCNLLLSLPGTVLTAHRGPAQTDMCFTVSADVPGMDKNDIKVNVDGDMLNISVEKASHKDEKKEEEGVKWHR